MNRGRFLFLVSLGFFLFAGAFVLLMSLPLGMALMFPATEEDPDAFWRALLLVDTVPLALALVPITHALGQRLPLRGLARHWRWLPVGLAVLVPASTLVYRLAVPADDLAFAMLEQHRAANVSSALMGVALVAALALVAWCLGPDRTTR